jgi:hypothetical protein
MPPPYSSPKPLGRPARVQLRSAGLPLLKMTLRPQEAAIAHQFEALRVAVLNEVLAEIAVVVAQEIAKRTPASGRDPLEEGVESLRQKWLRAPTVDIRRNVVEIGRLADLNNPPERGKRGTWRYGVWFNVEWGREYPHRGVEFIYQENPGQADQPGGPRDKPPGRGADIELSHWLGTGDLPGARPGVSLKGRRPASAPYPGAILGDVYAQRARHLRFRQRLLAKGFPASRLTIFQAGLFGTAPIRLGFAAGIHSVQDRIGTMMAAALKSIGKARP